MVTTPWNHLPCMHTYPRWPLTGKIEDFREKSMNEYFVVNFPFYRLVTLKSYLLCCALFLNKNLIIGKSKRNKERAEAMEARQKKACVGYARIR